MSDHPRSRLPLAAAVLLAAGAVRLAPTLAPSPARAESSAPVEVLFVGTGGESVGTGGESVGTATVRDTAQGRVVPATVKGLPSGSHAFDLQAVPPS